MSKSWSQSDSSGPSVLLFDCLLAAKVAITAADLVVCRSLGWQQQQHLHQHHCRTQLDSRCGAPSWTRCGNERLSHAPRKTTCMMKSRRSCTSRRQGVVLCCTAVQVLGSDSRRCSVTAGAAMTLGQVTNSSRSHSSSSQHNSSTQAVQQPLAQTSLHAAGPSWRGLSQSYFCCCPSWSDL